MSSGLRRSVRKIEPVTKTDSLETTEKFQNYLTTDHIILLGDPGSGKTYTFEEAAKTSNSRFMSIRNFLTMEGRGCEGKTLYLDGLDEYRSRSDDRNMVMEVIQLLNRLQCQSLRLSCRSADWLGDSDLSLFKEYFGEHSFAVLNLEPLTSEEISDLLRQKNINPPEFIESAERHNLGNLLSNPQTLIMLANVVGHENWPATKKELYEKSVELLLSEHSSQQSETELGKFDYRELLEPAGALCASILISDSAGVSISNNQTNNSYPTYRSISFADKTKVQACLTRRLFTATDTGSDFLTCIHRTIAEFTGAKWLATQIDQGFPIGRVQSLLGIDGFPTSELRGLHAWLATLLPKYAEALISKDPYGVLMYGDVASMPPSERHSLLMALETLSKTDPWFKAGNWSTKPLGTLSAPDMVEDFRRVLADTHSNPHLRSVVFKAIKNGPSLPQMRDDLKSLLSNSNAGYYERSNALTALYEVIPTGKDDLVEIYRSILANDPKTHKLRSKILAKIYAPYFNSEDVYHVFKDALDEADDHSVGDLWYLARSLPEEFLPDIVERLHHLLLSEPSNGRHREGVNIESAFSTLLERLLQSTAEPQPQQLFRWLKALYYFRRYGYGGSGKDGVSDWLKQHEPYIFKMFLSAYSELLNEEKKWSFIHDFQQITMNLLFSEDLTQQILPHLQSLDRLSEKEYWLYGSCMSLIFSTAPESLNLYLQYHKFALTDSALMEILNTHSVTVISDWRLDDNSYHKKHKRDKEERKRKNVENLTLAKKTIRSGKHLNHLGYLANNFFGVTRGSARNMEPLERLRDEIGDELTLDAIEGFSSIIRRNDMPTPKEISSGSYYWWWYALLAGMDLYWEKGKGFGEFSDQQLISLYALALEFHTYGNEENSAPYTKREWQAQIACDRPDLAEISIKEIIEAQLALKNQHISLLNELVMPENDSPWVSQFAMQMLSEFPATHSFSLMILMCIALSNPAHHSNLLDLAKKTICAQGKVRKEARAIWLVVGFMLDFQFFKNPLFNYSKDRDWVIWIVIDFSERVFKNRDSALQPIGLNIEQNEFIVLLFGKKYTNAHYPIGGSGWSGDQHPWDAAEFIRARINSISASPKSEATTSLKRLVDDTALDSYHEHLKHALANQLTIRREAEFIQPTWQQTLESLSGGKPANIADLHALTLLHLESIKTEIKQTNTDKYKTFWRIGNYGCIEKPVIENICRDRLIELLTPRLNPIEAHVEPEGHMAADKRADIVILSSPRLKLPLELKRDYKSDIWTACMNQLERLYARDPDAAGYGIYVVFWFGDKRGTKIPPHPNKTRRPETPQELEQLLQSLIPPDDRIRLQAIVIDVTPPQ